MGVAVLLPVGGCMLNRGHMRSDNEMALPLMTPGRFTPSPIAALSCDD
jgi:hypothetical protein